MMELKGLVILTLCLGVVGLIVWLIIHSLKPEA